MLLATLLFIILIIICLGGSFLITSGLVKLICICFSIAFTWKLALGIWLISIILGAAPTIKITVKDKDRS